MKHLANEITGVHEHEITGVQENENTNDNDKNDVIITLESDDDTT
jgi:hypothetical protein